MLPNPKLSLVQLVEDEAGVGADEPEAVGHGTLRLRTGLVSSSFRPHKLVASGLIK